MTDKIPLNELYVSELNVRKYTPSEIEEMAASILDKGLLQPLRATPKDDKGYGVHVGGRRLTAMLLLQQEGKLPNDHALILGEEIVVRAVDEARQIDESLTENVMREPMHPVDQYEAFQSLADRGKSVDEIAAAYGLDDISVRRRLALGRLSPVIRSAWRAGTIKAQEAQAFTLTDDQKRQEKVFAELSKSGRIWANNVRDHLIGDQRKSDDYLRFVGSEAYAEAGGNIGMDLFGGKQHVDDMPRLVALVDKRLEDECERLRTDGWGWVEIEREDTDWWRFDKLTPTGKVEESDELVAARAEMDELSERLEKADDGDLDLDPEEYRKQEDRFTELEESIEVMEEAGRLAAFGPKQKAKSGCLVSVGNGGSLHVRAGLLKAGQSGKGKSRGKDKPSEPEAASPERSADDASISAALVRSLSEQLSDAVGEAIGSDPDLALRLLVCEFESRADWRENRPLGLQYRRRGMPQYEPGAEPEEHPGWEERFAELQELKRADLLKRLARHVGDLYTTVRSHPQQEPSGYMSVPNAIKPTTMRRALKKAFDAEDFCKRANKAACLEIIRDVQGEDQVKVYSAKKVGEIRAHAQRCANQSGWLPPELRTECYEGPGAEDQSAKAA